MILFLVAVNDIPWETQAAPKDTMTKPPIALSSFSPSSLLLLLIFSFLSSPSLLQFLPFILFSVLSLSFQSFLSLLLLFCTAVIISRLNFHATVSGDMLSGFGLVGLLHFCPCWLVKRR